MGSGCDEIEEEVILTQLEANSSKYLRTVLRIFGKRIFLMVFELTITWRADSYVLRLIEGITCNYFVVSSD